MFWFNEPSSGQFLKQSNGTFSEYAHYGIPYCLQITLTLNVTLNSVSPDVLFTNYIDIKDHV